MELAGLLSKTQQILVMDPSAGPSQLEQHPGSANLAFCKSGISSLCLQEPGASPVQSLGQKWRESGWAGSTARQSKVETGNKGAEGR